MGRESGNKLGLVCLVLSVAFAPACDREQPDEVQYFLGAPAASVEATELASDFAVESVTVTSPGGTSLDIVRTVEPIAAVPVQSIEHARSIPRSPLAHGTIQRLVSVRLKLDEPLEREISLLRSRYKEYWIVTEIRGSEVGFHPFATPLDGREPGGDFASRDTARAAYADLGVMLEEGSHSTERLTQREEFDRAYRRAVVWYMECEPELVPRFVNAQKMGRDPFAGLAGHEVMTEVSADCEGPAPDFPPQIPTGR